MIRAVKAQVADLKQKFEKAGSIVFAHYLGLTVAQVSDLRRKLKEQNAEMKVAKKTLIRLAAKEASKPEPTEEQMQGDIACIFSFGDPIAGPQAAFTFAKEHKKISFVGGIFDGKLLSQQDATAFAQLPSRLQLLATFMSMVRSPLTTFSSMCSSPLRGFALAMSELAKKKAAA
ncbi:MAG: large subunit ribosomal protein L10 [Candidatus Peregrinibacteria bacterium Gr01-1014_25]|nr:MAG: large subunit ribosomal protein L10 [Candidatus Peregrinibacteria bacterium Gr01-1014_25]